MPNQKTDPPDDELPLTCSRASVELMRSFLAKVLTFRQLSIRSRSLTKGALLEPQEGALIGFVLQSDLDHEALKKGTKSVNLVGRSIYFTILPISTEPVSCLKWHRDWLGRESWSPRLIPAKVLNTNHAFSVSEPSIEALYRLQGRPIRRLLDCLKLTTKESILGITDEIQKRLTQFGRFGNAFFFQDVHSIIAWDIAVNWPAWEKSKASMDTRRLAVCENWSINMTDQEFKRLTPIEEIERLKNPPPRSAALSCAEKICEKVFALFNERPIRKQYTGHKTKKGESIYAEPNPFPFSRGGYFEEFLYRDDGSSVRHFPRKGESKTEEALRDTLWWWSSIKDWPDQLRDEFPDNWERSAFLYELRARLLPDHTWDIFEGPWFQLDVSQRAVLYYLWPPDRQGKHWRQGRIASDSPEEHKFVHAPLLVNPVASGTQISRAISKENRYFRHELLGINDTHTRKKPIKKEWRWCLLEALDLNYFGSSTLTNADIKARLRATTLHEEACSEIGLPPYQSVRKMSSGPKGAT